jgi:hypothetical protein
VVWIGLTFVLALVAAGVIAVRHFGDDALHAGRNLYRHRIMLEGATWPRIEDGPLLVWMGDSTILDDKGPSYPQLIDERLRTDHIASRVVANVGLDFYHYYFLMGRVLALRPDVVVLVAHLRVFNLRRFELAGNTQQFDDLASMIPASELWRALGLPLHARGISAPGLLLMRLFGYEGGERALYLVEGLRFMFQEADFWPALEVDEAPRTRWLRGMQSLAVTLQSYDVPLGRRQPVVRMMGATVRMSTAAGVRTLVVGSPIPYGAMGLRGWYDPADYVRRFAVLRAVVEENGGSFVDLHEALAREEFIDGAGHYNAAGAHHVADLVEPVVRAELHAAALHRPALRAEAR